MLKKKNNPMPAFFSNWTMQQLQWRHRLDKVVPVLFLHKSSFSICQIDCKCFSLSSIRKRNQQTSASRLRKRKCLQRQLIITRQSAQKTHRWDPWQAWIPQLLPLSPPPHCINNRLQLLQTPQATLFMAPLKN